MRSGLARFLVGFTILWAVTLAAIYLTQREVIAYYLLLYAGLGGAAVYLVSGAAWLLVGAAGSHGRQGLSPAKVVLAVLLLTPIAVGIWYAYTH